jgi:hypothetical protein
MLAMQLVLLVIEKKGGESVPFSQKLVVIVA